MNRRDATKNLCCLALTAAVDSWADATDPQSQSSSVSSASIPRVVAGVRIVDSTIAKRATEFCRDTSPEFLFNHCMRTFLFGALVGRATGKTFDEELLFFACIMHDLGLTEKFMGDLPFEIQGAEAAKNFLSANGVKASAIAIVWDGIAMHPLPIGQFKQPEIALVGTGAATDVLGPDPSQVKRPDVDEIVTAFPRSQFKKEFVKTCAQAVHRHPRTASLTFMRDIAERNLPDYHRKNICDGIVQAPFSE